MNVDVGIWSRLTKCVICLFVLAGVGFVAVWYFPLIQQNERMRKEIRRLDTQIQKEDGSAKQMKGDLNALYNDPKTVERLARQKLGYAKPGETVIRFEPAVTNAVTPK